MRKDSLYFAFLRPQIFFASLLCWAGAALAVTNNSTGVTLVESSRVK